MTVIRNGVRAGLLALAIGAVSPALADSTKEINGLVGPAAPVGMSFQELGAIKLGPEFPQIPEAEHYEMRGRYVTVAAGGIVPIHSHAGRPAVTYVIAGEIVEHRSDESGALVRRAGDVTIDDDGIAQWWENKTDQPVTMFVVDFRDPTKSGGH